MLKYPEALKGYLLKQETRKNDEFNYVDMYL